MVGEKGLRVVYTDKDPGACRICSYMQDLGAIRRGDIIESDIAHLDPSRVRGFDIIHLFAGIGAWDLALSFDGHVETPSPVVTASLPCTSYSLAGRKGGLDEHSLDHFIRIVKDLKPPIIFGEQVATPLAAGWFDILSARLARMDYTIGAAIYEAAAVGAPHRRRRLYWAAVLENPDSIRWTKVLLQRQDRSKVSWSSHTCLPVTVSSFGFDYTLPVDYSLRRVVDGIASKPCALPYIGRSIVPEAARVFVRAVLEWANEFYK